MGVHNLIVSELTKEAAGKKGKAYLAAVAEEFSCAADEGSKEDMAEDAKE